MTPRWSLLLLAALVPRTASADDASREVRVGFSELVYMTSFFGRVGTTIDATASMRLSRAWRGDAGVRLELPSGKPEAFGRIVIAPRRATWRPTAGIELGLSTRTSVGDEGGQLGDARMAANSGVSPVYVAFTTEPLSFAIGQRWVLTALDVQIGTQLSSPGRWTRVQIGILSFGARL